MRSAQKKTPASEKKNGKEQTSGKKLVQARLPFKILSGTPPSTSVEGGVPLAKLEVPPKKRKLSYTEETENPKKIGKSDSKENLTLEKIDSAAASTVANEEVVVILDDDEGSDKDREGSSHKTSIVGSKNKKSNKNTPRSAGSATTPKVQIKLPLSGKKKKRKSKRASRSAKCDVSDSSDVELVSEEQQHPKKKAKLTGDTEDQSVHVESQEEATEIEVQPEVDVDLNKNKQNTTISQKSKENKEEITISSKGNSVIVLGKSAPSSETNKSEGSTILKDDTTLEDDPYLSKVADKIKQIPKKEKKSNQQLSEIATSDCIAKDSECDPEEFTTPVKEKRASRRSIRQSELDQKKEENRISEEKLSSEPEFISEKSSAADTSINNELRKKLLTPKQLKQMEQRKKAREEKELKLQQLKEERDRKLQEQREERERKLQDEKMQKQKEREERELQRKKEREEKDEQKRREREEKEEQRRKEKEDKERKRLAEIEAKNEEKRKKDEAKEEERRKKEEDRRRKELEKEEEENKKKKAAQAFTKFFVAKTTKPPADDDQESRDDAESVHSLAFRPFQVKGDMKLAPLVRCEFNERSRGKLDSFLNGTQKDEVPLYLDELKSGAHIPLRGSKTVYKDSGDDEVIIIENELETAAQAIDEARPKGQKYKAKFYSFRENRRPPFYGTWRKKSTVITSRRPFATDKKFFDYEVDSDDEWEEEEPGESLNGSEDEKDESEDEDYEVDNEWFVPHGHLSDEELQNEDELGPDTSREAQKAKLKALQQEFAKEMKKKTEKIKPRLIGAIWEDENGNRPSLCPNIIWDSLFARAMMFCEPPLVEEPETPEIEPGTPPPEKQKRLEINDELMGDLVRLVHGNRHSRVFLIKEYMEHVSNTCETIKSGECLAPTKSLIREKIDEISEWSVVEASSAKKKNKKKLCWVVSADILDKYSLGKLGLRNEWSYKLQPRFDDKSEPNAEKEMQEDPVEPESSETPKRSENIKKKGITKFAKVLTKEEKQNQLTASSPVASASPKVTSRNSSPAAKSKDSPKTKAPRKPVTPVVEKLPPPSPPTTKTPVVKKRVALLMSVPPGQQFSPQSKNALISNFLKKNKSSTSSAEEKSAASSTSDAHKDVDEVVALD